MADSCLLYYITDRKTFPGDERARRLRLLDKIAEAASCGIDYIQLREKDMSVREMETLAREAVRVIHDQTYASGFRHPVTALLINSRTDVALASGAAGVHLPADDGFPEEVRAAWRKCVAPAPARKMPRLDPVMAVSCHTPEEVTEAVFNKATFAVFAPVFEKKNMPGATPAGLDALRQACHTSIPVIALGGVTLQNAEFCLRAGAAGIAAIRLFQENDIAMIVRELRGM